MDHPTTCQCFKGVTKMISIIRLPDLYSGDIIPLRSAYLCVSCDSIGQSAMTCPYCGDRSLLCLSRILNRKEKASD